MIAFDYTALGLDDELIAGHLAEIREYCQRLSCTEAEGLVKVYRDPLDCLVAEIKLHNDPWLVMRAEVAAWFLRGVLRGVEGNLGDYFKYPISMETRR